MLLHQSKRLRTAFASREQLLPLLYNAAALVLPLLIFLRTMAPTVYALDSAELTTGAYTLGIIHAPGSPLYLLIGHVFTWLPFGDVGYRLNLLSACSTALTTWFVYRILLQLTQHRLINLMSALALAFSYYVWIVALFAELYALHGCFVMGLLWLTLCWRKERQAWQLYLLGFGFGLSLGNHLSMVLEGPGLVWLAVSVPGISPQRLKQFLFAALLALLGSMVYLYLPLRSQSDTALNYVRMYWNIDLRSWDGFWWMISGRMFGSLFFSIPLNQLPAEAGTYLYQLWSNFFGIGTIIGCIGLITHLKKDPGLHSGLILMFIGHLFFYLTYGAKDKQVMFLPTFLIFGLWIGLGIVYLEQKSSQSLPQFGSLLIGAIVVLLLFVNFNRVDLSNDWSARTLGESILAQVEPDTTYFGTWVDVPLIEYLQLVEGKRPDVHAIQLFFTDTTKARRIAYGKLKAHSPVYSSSASILDPALFQSTYYEWCKCYRLRLRHQ